MTIKEAKDLTTLKMDELMGTLQTHEHQIKKSNTSSQGKYFKAQVNSRDKGKGRNSSSWGLRSRVHWKNGQWNPSVEILGRSSNQEGESSSQNNYTGGKKNYNTNKRNVECYYYHKVGNYTS